MFSSMTTLKFEIPKGLPSLIHRLSKAIIRAQPNNLYEFSATYLEEELRNRDQQQHPTANEDEADKRRENSGKYAGNQGDSCKKEYEHEKAATTIQAGFRGYKTRKEMKLVRRSATEEVPQKLKSPQLSTIKEEEEAATKIQAGVRGYLLRKKMKHSMDMDQSQSTDMGDTIDESSSGNMVNSIPENDVLPNSQSKQEMAVEGRYEETQRIPATTSDSDDGNTVSEVGGLSEMRDNNVTNSNAREPETILYPEVPHSFDIPGKESDIVTKFEMKTSNATEDSALNLKASEADSSLSEPVKEESEKFPTFKSSLSEHATEEMDVESSTVQPKFETELVKEVAENTENLQPTESESPIELNTVGADTVSCAVPQIGDAEKNSKLEGESNVEQDSDSFTDEIKILDEVEERSVTDPAEDAGSVVITPEPATAVELEKSSGFGSQGEPEAEAAKDLSDAPGSAAEMIPVIPKETVVKEAVATEELPVQRRSSKRKTAAGAEKYRSGVVVDSFLLEEPATSIHQMQRLEELDAEIESDTAELNSAAAKIQAGFRGYQVRKGLNNAATKIQSNYRGYKTRKDLRNQANAAVKIQATVRGYLTRKRVYKTRAQQLEQRRRDAARRRSSSSVMAVNPPLSTTKRNSE